MPDTAGRKRLSPREERVSRTYRLPLAKLRAAKRALGAATTTEAIERALDLAVFQRDPIADEALQRCHRAFSPFEHLSVIVAQELRAGVKQARDRKVLERNVLSVFELASRTITPSAGAWHRSGDLLSEMAKEEGQDIARLSTAFANDVLLALSRRESGCVLVTENDRDFSRIRRFISFAYVKPCPRTTSDSSVAIN